MLRLYYHPLASFCWKALIALYENATPFEAVLVDLADPASRNAFAAVWPLAKFPVLRDEARGNTVAEATVVIEYLEAHFPGRTRLVPADADAAWRARMWDRFYDNYIHEPMQRIVLDRLRPEAARDAMGVAQAHAQISQACEIADREIGDRPWAMGDAFGLVDCAAAPALFYANTVQPFDGVANLEAYLGRLARRPSFARVLKEAEPYFVNFPLDPKPRMPG
jgi:glutathione S-transferase